MKFNVYVLSIYDLIFFANFFAWITLVFIQYKGTTLILTKNGMELLSTSYFDRKLWKKFYWGKIRRNLFLKFMAKFTALLLPFCRWWPQETRKQFTTTTKYVNGFVIFFSWNYPRIKNDILTNPMLATLFNHFKEINYLQNLLLKLEHSCIFFSIKDYNQQFHGIFFQA